MAITDSEFIGVSELAAAVGDALSEIAQHDRKMKSGATEIPTERTIRFYLEKGLLPKPSKKLGQTLVFGRVHLLHLLVIKKLQADGVPLSSIPDILKKRGKTVAQLEELLGESLPDSVGARSAAVEFPSEADSQLPPTGMTYSTPLASKSMSAPSRQEIPANAAPPASGAKSYLKSLLARTPKAPDQAATRKAPELDVLFSHMPSSKSARWTRHEPADGLEINVSDDYEPPTDEQGKVKLLESIRKILGI